MGRAFFTGLEIISSEMIGDQGPERGSHLPESHSMSETSHFLDHALLSHMRQVERWWEVGESLLWPHHTSPPCSPFKPLRFLCPCTCRQPSWQALARAPWGQGQRHEHPPGQARIYQWPSCFLSRPRKAPSLPVPSAGREASVRAPAL